MEGKKRCLVLPILSHAVEEFLEVEGVSKEAKRKILWDYCARLYGL